LFKLLNEEGIWQELLYNKYLKHKTLAQVEAKPIDSPFWEGILHGKDDFFAKESFAIGHGQSTQFWEDAWLDKNPLVFQYPSLYAIVQHKNVRVADVLTHTPLNIGFTRVLRDRRWERWLYLVERLMNAQLLDEPDKLIWHLTTSGVFLSNLYMRST
jgi:hypothetical protein